jgi:hypothetical protein
VRGLGEHRRGVADGADIDAVDAHRLQHRWTELELDPLHLDVERIEQCLEAAVLLRREQGRLALLEADAEQPGTGGTGLR